jgi:hypothetical protein
MLLEYFVFFEDHAVVLAKASAVIASALVVASAVIASTSS